MEKRIKTNQKKETKNTILLYNNSISQTNHSLCNNNYYKRNVHLHLYALGNMFHILYKANRMKSYDNNKLMNLSFHHYP